jgi:F420-0:gamma-glutamyl ligase
LLINKGVYFIWGVFSAFEKNETIDLDEIKVEPYAEGNPKIQHPKAVVELVLWDSSSILLSKDNTVSKNFRNTFQGWKD